MKTIDSIKKGEQIFSTYGLINNEELLRRYGLVRLRNTCMFIDQSEAFNLDLLLTINHKSILWELNSKQ